MQWKKDPTPAQIEAAKKAWFRSVAKIRKEVLNNKNVTSVSTDAEGWTVVKYRGGAVFKMRGEAVTAALSTLDVDAGKPEKLYHAPKKGEKIGWIIDTHADIWKKRKVFKRAAFEYFGEPFFVYNTAHGYPRVTHDGTGAAITTPGAVSVADCVQAAIEKMDELGKEKLLFSVAKFRADIEKHEVIESDEEII